MKTRKITSYKELFIKSQAKIADAIDNLETISEELKKCMQECKNVGAIDNLRTISEELKKFMQECEDEVISMENKIVEIGKKS